MNQVRLLFIIVQGTPWTCSHFVSIWKFEYVSKCREGSNIRMNKSDNFSHTILTMKYKVKGNIEIKLKNTPISLKQIIPLVITSKTVNYMISIRCFVVEIQEKIRKRSMIFCTGVKFSKWSDFVGMDSINWTALQIQKRYSLPSARCPDIGQWMGQRSAL